jgi:hypothetical protein
MSCCRPNSYASFGSNGHWPTGRLAVSRPSGILAHNDRSPGDVVVVLEEWKTGDDR